MSQTGDYQMSLILPHDVYRVSSISNSGVAAGLHAVAAELIVLKMT